MKISIITVVYNNEKTIREAIKSVLNQNYQQIEYIIIDGGSKDNTISIIKEYENQITQFVSEPDNGLYDAMNKGIRLASGDVIGIINSDDLYQDNNVISDVMNEFMKDESMDLLYCDLVYVNQFDTKKVIRNWKSKNYYHNFFENGNVPPHPTLFVRSAVYKVVGVFDLQYKLASDYELMLRIFKKYDFKNKYFNRLVIRMRLGGASNQSIKNILNQNREILNAWKNNGLKAPFYLMPFRLFKRLIQFI